MTPKEKAADLFNKFYDTSAHQNSVAVRRRKAKEGAIICVDEIMKSNKFDPVCAGMTNFYWKGVKDELEKM